MKKLFFFLSLVFSISAFASKDQVPLEADLANYYDPSKDGDNHLTNEEANTVYDLRVDTEHQARYDDSPLEYVVLAVNLPVANCPETIEVTGDFDGWVGTTMELLDSDWWFVELEAKPAQSFKFRSAGSWDRELELYDNENEVWKKIGDDQLVFGELWQDDSWHGYPCKWIELDFSDPDKYRWAESNIRHGQCGDNLQWTYRDSVLTIVGTGDMWDGQPWALFHQEIKQVILAPGITSIGDYAFNDCIGLVSVTIPNSVTSIGEGAFYSCRNLTSINIPNSVTSIGDEAFLNCYNLTSINIPSCAISIGDAAFCNCYSLTSIEIPNSVTTIGNSAFSGCSGLTSIEIPNSVVSIGDEAFYGVCNITYNGIATGAPWEARSINGFIDGWLVYADATRIELRACSTSATGEIVLPNSVTTIGDRAFEACKRITSVIISNSVKSIGDYAFEGCSGLTSITLPDGVISIGDKAFYECYYLSSINIPSSVVSIGDWAFEGCYFLPIIDGGVYADTYLVYGINKDTTSFTIKDGTRWIGSGAFSSCSSLTSVTIPNSVTSIGEGAFNMCTSLTSITLPDGVTSIGDYAFYMCTSLTSINIPNSVVRIGKKDYYTFKECESLPVIDGIRYADTYLIEPIEHLSTYKIKEGTRWIGADAFKEEFNLTSIVIPNSVVYIESGAFCDCDELKSVTIGSGVTRIGAFAFYGSNQLKSIICLPQVPPTTEVEVRSDRNYGAFDDDASILLYVPTESVEAYRRDECWGKFEIHPLEAESVEVTDIKVVSTDNSAEVVWPAVSNAATYELVIKDKDGNVICSLVFSGNGQLVSITFGAPTREKSVEATQLSGFAFTVEDLEEGSTYDLTITARDENNNVLDVKSMSFVAGGGEQQDIEEINVVGVRSSKLLHNSQIIILRGDKTYTLTGQEVK